MTLGTWSPDNASPSEPTSALLREVAELGQAGVESFPRTPPESLEPLRPWMRQTRARWQPILEPLSTGQLLDLTRFFTLAEQHWAGWEGQDKNPVVWICKVLKTRGAFPDDELIRWIKSHTENRFLPYGNPLA